MKTHLKKFLGVALALSIVLSCTISVYAYYAKSSSVSAGPFGTLTGTLGEDGMCNYDQWYMFNFMTEVTTAPSGSYITANIEVYDYYTGEWIDHDRAIAWDSTRTGYTFQLDHLANFMEKKYTVYGAHQGIWGNEAYVAYTVNEYCYQDLYDDIYNNTR